MGTLSFTTSQINQAIACKITPPTQDIVDGVYTSGSPRAVTAGTEYKLIFNAGNLARNYNNGFNAQTGISKMWNFTDNVSDYSEFADTPNFDALPNCYFQPSAANAGECIIRAYVNETVPIFHDQAIVGYKGLTPEKMGDVFKYYIGDEVGYQIKSKGIYFTFEFDHNGNMWDMGLYHHVI